MDRLWRVPNQPKTPLLGARVPSALQERIAALAAALGRTKSDLINEAIRDLLEKYK